MQIKKVLKFGGTSVGAPERMHQVAKLIKSGEAGIVVLSALSGATNQLVEISKCYQKGDKDKAALFIKQLHEKYQTFISKLYSKDDSKNKALTLIEDHFKFLLNFANDLFTVHEERAILAQGELISTALFQYYLEEIGEKSILLPALNFMRIDENKEPMLEYIRENLNAELEKHPDCKLFVTQGYICRNSYGKVDNLKRGGSDYTASLIGAALKCDEIQIWTDIDGMHNNDPRFVDRTYPVSEISFDEAAELAYFGAKILHPSSILPAWQENIPVRLLNTMQPEAKGTLISNNDSNRKYVAVAAKDGIVAIKIKSSRMLLAYGFLRSVFEVFERYKTPIDMITTSEVAVSLTIDNTAHLNDILRELEEYASVEVDKDQTIICIVGNFDSETTGYAQEVLKAFSKIPIRMISYGGSKKNISLLINEKYKKQALQSVNDVLFMPQEVMA
jgi:aspartate kinase